MKRSLIIEIDCGEYADDEHCGSCPKRTVSKGWDYCTEFGVGLAPALAHLLGLAHRCDECKTREIVQREVEELKSSREFRKRQREIMGPELFDELAEEIASDTPEQRRKNQIKFYEIVLEHLKAGKL